jgi:hypothetical protein
MTPRLTTDVWTRDEQAGPNRWEWRVFARSGLGRYASGYVAGMISTSHADLYFVSANPLANVKIREGRVELKTRVRSSKDGLELWQPEFVEAFPLSRVAMRRLSRVWYTAVTPTIITCTTEAQFAEFARSCLPSIHAIPVVKHRRRFTVLNCRAELVELSVLGERWESLALEDAEPAVVRASVRALGLSDLPTSNYPAAIARVARFATPR